MSAEAVGAETRLRTWLTVDAIITGANALAYLVLAGVLTGALGSTVGALRGVGGYLLVFTVLIVVAIAGRSRGLAVVVVVGNSVWVLASLVVAAAGLLDLTGVGRLWALLQAVVVGALALMQSRAIRASDAA